MFILIHRASHILLLIPLSQGLTVAHQTSIHILNSFILKPLAKGRPPFLVDIVLGTASHHGIRMTYLEETADQENQLY